MINARYIFSGIFFFILQSVVFAGDYGSCADELDRLKRATRDASDAADSAKSKSESLQYCRQRSSSSDIMSGACQSDSNDLRSASSDLSSALDTLTRRYKNVADACEIDGPALSPTQKTGDAHCDIYRPYLGKLPVAALIKTCSQYMPESECEKCVSFQPTVPGTSVPLQKKK